MLVGILIKSTEVPVDLVIDHSVQVDSYANPNALERNMKLEFERNYERYQFLNWATKAFDNYNAVPLQLVLFTK